MHCWVQYGTHMHRTGAVPMQRCKWQFVLHASTLMVTVARLMLASLALLAASPAAFSSRSLRSPAACLAHFACLLASPAARFARCLACCSLRSLCLTCCSLRSWLSCFARFARLASRLACCSLRSPPLLLASLAASPAARFARASPASLASLPASPAARFARASPASLASLPASPAARFARSSPALLASLPASPAARFARASPASLASLASLLASPAAHFAAASSAARFARCLTCRCHSPTPPRSLDHLASSLILHFLTGADPLAEVAILSRRGGGVTHRNSARDLFSLLGLRVYFIGIA